MDALRVLHVLHKMDYAGTETLLMNLYRVIDRERIQFDFAVCSQEQGDYDSEIEALGGRIIHYPRYTGTNHFEYVKWWRSFFEKHPEYRIVHGHIGSTAAIYLHIASRCGRYTIAHSHATNSGKISFNEILYRIYSYPTRFIANYYLGCSKAALVDRYGRRIANDKTRARVFFNAIDAEKFTYNEKVRAEVRADLKLGDCEIVLGTVGRLAPEKNPFMILDLIYKLKRRGAQFTFLWLGKGSMEPDIKQRIREMHLEETIIMLGARSDINRMLQAMDIFVFPSLFEGLGITCVEAQAADLRCFCSNVIPEEARVTEKFEPISIDDINEWVDRVGRAIEQRDFGRRDRSKEMMAAGYDIHSQTEWLTKFYLNTAQHQLA